MRRSRILIGLVGRILLMIKVHNYGFQAFTKDFKKCVYSKSLQYECTSLKISSMS